MPQTDVCADAPLEGYAFAYLDETTKRMIRRGLLKAVAIPGYQVPFASREMPMPCGWGTGGIQVLSLIHIFCPALCLTGNAPSGARPFSWF